ncbi:ABC transporter substrate-binding protein [Streptomyces sp. NPDC046862]|uniref:ABC transporter substrate-binding protein n=1 Tax=Streptomyces sp. NPDC046862 TaxID=3154603 RepID=UPI0034539D9F
MRSRSSVLGAGLMAAGLVLTACSSGTSVSGSGTKTLQLWFWGASPQQQKVMRDVLVGGFDRSQSKYKLQVTFNNAVDKNVQVALSANKGPDIVYGSGPAFAAAYATQGKLADMTPYAEKYGWKDRVLAPMYESGTMHGKLYSLPNSLEGLGIFYNKKVLAKLGVGVPTTYDELVAAMNKAKDAGMYASVTGNKGWKPVNQNYISMFLTHVAGGKAVYDALQGTTKWTDPKIVKAVEASAAFYKEGYLGGKDYANLNFLESMQLLAEGKSPFFFGPTLAFQFADSYFNDKAGNIADLGFTTFPNVTPGLPSPATTLGTTASLSINAHSPNKDGAAEVIDYMMSEKFAQQINKSWPGYWAVPLKDFNLDPASYTGLSKAFVESAKDTIATVNKGDYGLFAGTFFPPATATAFTDVDSVWLGTESAKSFLADVQKTFDGEKAKGLVPPLPEPAS